MENLMKHTITLIPGDGIGPEIVAATVRIIEATGVEIEWETQIIGAYALEKFGVTIPEETIASIKRNKVALKGPLATPIGKGFTSVNVGLRKALDLIRQCASGQSSAECRMPLSRTRSRHRPRKHRRFIRRTRTRRRSRRGRINQDHHRKSLDAHRQIRF